MVGCWVELVAPGDRIGLLEWEEILGVGEVASEGVASGQWRLRKEQIPRFAPRQGRGRRNDNLGAYRRVVRPVVGVGFGAWRVVEPEPHRSEDRP